MRGPRGWESSSTSSFGVYAVGDDHEETRKIRTVVGSFVRDHEHVRGFHAVCLDPDANRIYCDLTVDYALRDWDVLRAEFMAYMKDAFPENDVELTIETEFV